MRTARQFLIHQLWNLKTFQPHTYGERDTIERDLPNAIEALIDERIKAVIGNEAEDAKQKVIGMLETIIREDRGQKPS